MGAQTDQQFATEPIGAHGLGIASSGVNRVIERGTAAPMRPHWSTRHGGGR